MRLLALACLLLVSVASSAQAAHIHGQWLPDHAQKAGAPADASQLPGGEEHCSLCVAMHSALPVAQRVAPVHLLVSETRVVTAEDRAPDALWHFALFSRPPPVLETL
jgi:hypothetical protein